jgi:uncharacterized delta-60 repeat protein
MSARKQDRSSTGSFDATGDGYLFEPLESRQLMNGAPDLTFGPAGQRVPPLGFAIADLAVQADGKMVVVGTLNDDFVVARLLPDGRPDPRFGTAGNGIVTTTFGGSSDEARAVAVHADGRIVVGGIKINGFDDFQMAIARYLPNGSPDPTFDGDGKAVRDPGTWSSSSVNDLVVRSDGRILLAGTHIGFASDGDYMVTRLMPDGAYDRSFGAIVPNTTYRTGYSTAGFGGFYEGAEAIAVQPDGRIVVGGQTTANGHTWALARFNSNGTLDHSFDGDAKFRSAMVDASLSGIALDSNGKVLIGGRWGRKSMVQRLNGDGSLDNSFRIGESVTIDLAAQGYESVEQLLITPHKKILAIARAGDDMVAVRLLPDGQRDPTFGIGGLATFSFNSASVTAAAYDNFGRVVAAGGDTMARFYDVLPQVNVASWDTHAAEGGSDPGTIIVTRDRAYHFATRVQVARSGDATYRIDYTDSLAFLGGWIDIPAGQSFVLVTVSPRDDAVVEPNESVRLSLQAMPAYTRGSYQWGDVTIWDNDQVPLRTGRHRASNSSPRPIVNAAHAPTTAPSDLLPRLLFSERPVLLEQLV